MLLILSVSLLLLKVACQSQTSFSNYHWEEVWSAVYNIVGLSFIKSFLGTNIQYKYSDTLLNRKQWELNSMSLTGGRAGIWLARTEIWWAGTNSTTNCAWHLSKKLTIASAYWRTYLPFLLLTKEWVVCKCSENHKTKRTFKEPSLVRHRWLTPVILAT
jgi:hypothetical protein